MRRPKILLLNPPGRALYVRDYFCSKVSQADYINHPIDFVFLSGILRGQADLSLIDAIVERLSPAACLGRVQEVEPDVVVGLTGSVSYREDVQFYGDLKKRLGCRLILIGDILIDKRRERLESLPFVDAFLHDFSGHDLLCYLGLERAEGPVRNMTFREPDGTATSGALVRERGKVLQIPTPDHSLFQGLPYRYPFVRSHRFATLMTEYGCPYRCEFCIMSTLGWGIRCVEDVMEELQEISALGVRELFFLDQTFGIDKVRASQLLSQMVAAGLDFGWVCFSRPDVVDSRLLEQMRRAGCHTIIMGLESGSERILEAAKKDYTVAAIRQGFRLCREHQLQTVATVILGLPEETLESFETTMNLLRELQPDFVSFNVAVPRMGTPFRERAFDLGLIEENCETMDQSGFPVAMPTLTLTRSEIGALKRRAVRDFYFNLDYVGRRMRLLVRRPNLQEWGIQIRQGALLLRNLLRSAAP